MKRIAFFLCSFFYGKFVSKNDRFVRQQQTLREHTLTSSCRFIARFLPCSYQNHRSIEVCQYQKNHNQSGERSYSVKASSLFPCKKLRQADQEHRVLLPTD